MRGLVANTHGPRFWGPAGVATREARTVDVARMALAAQIRHGKPLCEIKQNFDLVMEAEEILRNK